jgi:hypothetical protein
MVFDLLRLFVLIGLICVFFAILDDGPYYTACTGAGNSYYKCFYDRVIKP